MEELNQCNEIENFCIKLICEFLLCYDFKETLKSLLQELERSSFSLPNPLPVKKDRITKETALEILAELKNYQYLHFFEKWSNLIPDGIKNSSEYKNLTLPLYTYFATLPLKDVNADDTQSETNNCSIDNQVKRVTEVGKIENLNVTFVIEKSSNPTCETFDSEKLYKKDSSETQADILESDKQNNVFVEHEKEAEHPPTAMSLFKEFILEKGHNFSTETDHLPLFALPFVDNPKEHPALHQVFEEKWMTDLGKSLEQFLIKYSCGDLVVPEIVKLCRQNYKFSENIKTQIQTIDENNKRYKDIKRKLHKLKRDHKNLVAVATELATALENSVRGELVDLQSTLVNCVAIFPELFPESNNGKTYPHRVTFAGNLREKEHVCISNLDVEKMREDLYSGSTKTKLLLLQALRWHLCEVSSEERELAVGWLERTDLLGLRQAGGPPREDPGPPRDWLCPLRAPHPLQQSMARLLNAIASLQTGRDYIAASPATLHCLIRAAGSPDTDSITQHMIIATLQKLSLRKRLCEVMISRGLPETVASRLEPALGCYYLRYATSLFMNLSLYTPVDFWDTRPHLVLPPLVSLLQTNYHHQQVVEFVCGCLYWLLRSDKVNIFARSLALGDALSSLASPGLSRQIHALLALHHRHVSPPLLSPTFTDDHLEDPEELEAEINEEDPVRGSPSGHHLLSQHYLLLFNTPSVVGRISDTRVSLGASTPRSKDLPAWAL